VKPSRLYAAIGFLSAAAIAFQLALMQILSITQWHHFAYMILSVALLGFGAAGTVLAMFRSYLMERFDRILPALMFFCAISMGGGIDLSQHPVARFDSYLLFAGAEHAGRLLLIYGIFFVPFFLAALAIGLTFTKDSRNIGVLYFWNLIGSGAGSLLALCLMWILPPRQIPAILALIPLISGLLTMPRKPGALLQTTALVSLLSVAVATIQPGELVLSEFKSLSRAMQLPAANTAMERNSPYGFLQVYSSPALRYAPGLSLTYPGNIPVRRAVFNNGDWVGPLLNWRRNEAAAMDFSTAALPYILDRPATALVLDMSTGASVVHALSHGIREITAVEPNPALISLLTEELAAEIGHLLRQPSLNVANTDPRAWLLTDRQAYDLIVLPTIDTFGGTAGLNAIQEHYLFTKEAFGDAWRRLTPRGVLCITCWMDYPPRHTLKMLATIVEMLADQGIDDPRSVIAAARSWGAITFAVKKTPYSLEEIERIRAFCLRLNFDPALLPGIQASERTFFNAMQDDLFFNTVDRLLSSQRKALYTAYDFHIEPATDDRPYFARFLRWQSLRNLSDHFGNRTVPFFEIGYLVVFLTLLQILPAGLLLMVIPLLSRRRTVHGRAKGRIFLYFSGIGMGYLLVEMAFIQRFGLYFGNSLQGAAAAISILLSASGLGSYASGRLKDRRIYWQTGALAGIIFLLLLGSIWLTPLLLKSIGLAPPFRLLLALLVLFPLGFLMGIPFPTGIRTLGEKCENEIPWAWGINGCFSVISTALATIVAIEAGFAAVMVCAALAYGCALAVLRRLTGQDPVTDSPPAPDAEA